MIKEIKLALGGKQREETWENLPALYAVNIKNIVKRFPVFHSPNSRQFKCNQCGKINKWDKKQINFLCACGKIHLRLIGVPGYIN